MLSNFHFLVPESFYTKFGLERHGNSVKKRFEFVYVHDFGPRSRKDLDLQYSHTSINSIRCLLLQTSRSQTAIGSKKSTVFTFFTEKPKLPSLTLP